MIAVWTMYSEFAEKRRDGRTWINIVKVIHELLGAPYEESAELARERFWESGDDTVSRILLEIENINTILMTGGNDVLV